MTQRRREIVHYSYTKNGGIYANACCSRSLLNLGAILGYTECIQMAHLAAKCAIRIMNFRASDSRMKRSQKTLNVKRIIACFWKLFHLSFSLSLSLSLSICLLYIYLIMTIGRILQILNSDSLFIFLFKLLQSFTSPKTLITLSNRLDFL